MSLFWRPFVRIFCKKVTFLPTKTQFLGKSSYAFSKLLGTLLWFTVQGMCELGIPKR